MLRELFPLVPALLWAVTITPTQAQVAFTGDYLEDFDAMGATGTTLPAGWSAVRAAGSGTAGASLTPALTTGTATSGGIFNVGLSGDPDRALGSLSSSATVPRFGAQFLNQSGDTVNDVSFSAMLEQWRSGSSTTANETLSFEYSLNALDVNDAAATWLSLSSMNLMEILTGSTTAGAVNGNLPDHQLSLSGALADLSWANNSVLTVRWTDADDTGSDGLYALDTFRITAGASPVPEPTGLGTAALGLGLLAAFRRWQRRV